MDQKAAEEGFEAFWFFWYFAFISVVNSDTPSSCQYLTFPFLSNSFCFHWVTAVLPTSHQAVTILWEKDMVHENQLKLYSYSTSQVESQTKWMSRLLRTQWGPLPIPKTHPKKVEQKARRPKRPNRSLNLAISCTLDGRNYSTLRQSGRIRNCTPKSSKAKMIYHEQVEKCASWSESITTFWVRPYGYLCDLIGKYSQ